MDYYLKNGVVYCDESLFLFAVSYDKDVLGGDIENIGKIPLDKIDCWYVHYASGDLKRIFEISPYDLEWCAFERGDKEIKFYKMDRIRRLIYGQTQKQNTTTTKG
jgi:hypothetical protein